MMIKDVLHTHTSNFKWKFNADFLLPLTSSQIMNIASLNKKKKKKWWRLKRQEIAKHSASFQVEIFIQSAAVYFNLSRRIKRRISLFMIFIENFSVCLAAHKSFADKKFFISQLNQQTYTCGAQIFDWKFHRQESILYLSPSVDILKCRARNFYLFFDGELISIFWPHFDSI